MAVEEAQEPPSTLSSGAQLPVHSGNIVAIRKRQKHRWKGPHHSLTVTVSICICHEKFPTIN